MNFWKRVTSFFRREPKSQKSSTTTSTTTKQTNGRGITRLFGGRKSQKLASGEIGTSSNPNYTEPVNDFGGSRTTIPKFSQGGGGLGGALPKKTQSDLGLDERTLSRASIEDLIDTLMDAHPDVSYALWNFLRIGNTDYEITVKKINGKPFAPGEKAINEWIQSLEAPNVMRFESSRSLRKVVNQLMMSVITRGAASCELVLTPDLSNVAFIAPVDPATITFRFEQDRFVPYQDEDKINLDIPTFLYEALDERIDDPYGRSPILGAINMVLFQMQILNDIKAVVHNQGYPRFDITILEEVLLKRMPISIRNNEQAKQKWLNDKLQEIIEMYNNLDVDDTFVHYDSVEINMVGGKQGGGGAMIDPQKLMAAVDNLIMSGLKTLSTILGRRSTGNTESFAKMEIKLYLKGVEAIQEVVERIISRALTLLLNIQGKQGFVEFKFKPVEIRTELEKAQFEQISLQNWAYKRDQGWIDQEEAAMGAVGHEPVGEPDWEALEKSKIKNKDGGEVQGQRDEKGTNSPTESTSNSDNN